MNSERPVFDWNRLEISGFFVLLHLHILQKHHHAIRLQFIDVPYVSPVKNSVLLS